MCDRRTLAAPARPHATTQCPGAEAPQTKHLVVRHSCSSYHDVVHDGLSLGVPEKTESVLETVATFEGRGLAVRRAGVGANVGMNRKIDDCIRVGGPRARRRGTRA
jgi:hypothetical protein